MKQAASATHSIRKRQPARIVYGTDLNGVKIMLR